MRHSDTCIRWTGFLSSPFIDTAANLARIASRTIDDPLPPISVRRPWHLATASSRSTHYLGDRLGVRFGTGEAYSVGFMTTGWQVSAGRWPCVARGPWLVVRAGRYFSCRSNRPPLLRPGGELVIYGANFKYRRRWRMASHLPRTVSTSEREPATPATDTRSTVTRRTSG